VFPHPSWLRAHVTCIEQAAESWIDILMYTQRPSNVHDIKRAATTVRGTMSYVVRINQTTSCCRCCWRRITWSHQHLSASPTADERPNKISRCSWLQAAADAGFPRSERIGLLVKNTTNVNEAREKYCIILHRALVKWTVTLRGWEFRTETDWI